MYYEYKNADVLLKNKDMQLFRVNDQVLDFVKNPYRDKNSELATLEQKLANSEKVCIIIIIISTRHMPNVYAINGNHV